MFRVFLDLCNLFFLWVFLHVGAFFLMIVAIFYVIKSNPTPPTPIIHEHINQTVQNIIQPQKRVLVDREVCKDIRGCEMINVTCPTCVVEKVWE